MVLIAMHLDRGGAFCHTCALGRWPPAFCPAANPRMGVSAMRLYLVAALAMLSGAIGCGQAEAPKAPTVMAETNAAISQAASSMASAAPSDPIALVVFEFLDAVRQGDTNAAGQRLTPLALKRTSEQDLVFAPPGSATARFKVGNVEMIDQEKAVVDSVWTDLDADGKPHDEPTLWALKLTEGKWRISGMMADMGAGEAPTPIDFENPESLGAPKTASPSNVVGPSEAAPGQPATGEVARNPFEQPAQR